MRLRMRAPASTLTALVRSCSAVCSQRRLPQAPMTSCSTWERSPHVAATHRRRRQAESWQLTQVTDLRFSRLKPTTADCRILACVLQCMSAEMDGGWCLCPSRMLMGHGRGAGAKMQTRDSRAEGSWVDLYTTVYRRRARGRNSGTATAALTQRTHVLQRRGAGYLFETGYSMCTSTRTHRLQGGHCSTTPPLYVCMIECSQRGT